MKHFIFDNSFLLKNVAWANNTTYFESYDGHIHLYNIKKKIKQPQFQL